MTTTAYDNRDLRFFGSVNWQVSIASYKKEKEMYFFLLFYSTVHVGDVYSTTNCNFVCSIEM